MKVKIYWVFGYCGTHTQKKIGFNYPCPPAHSQLCILSHADRKLGMGLRMRLA